MSSSEGTLILTLVTLALFGASSWFSKFRKKGVESEPNVISKLLWGVVTLAGVASWWGLPPDTSKLHTWDLYHYYIGTKYFEELRYTGIYNCSLKAEGELLAASGSVNSTTTSVRDLASNTFISGAEALERSTQCFERFTPERWRDFVADISWFSARMGERWKTVFHDHGYNPSPFWVWIAKRALPVGAVNDEALLWIARLDIVLIACMWAVLLATFDTKVVAVAAVLWGTSPLANGSWTAGGYLRHDWLLATVLAVVLLWRYFRDRVAPLRSSERYVAVCAGALLGYAISVRIFPFVVLLAVLCCRTRNRPGRPLWGVFPPSVALVTLGALISVVSCVTVSSVTFGSTVWGEFRDNTRKHVDSRSGNLVGVSHVVDHYVQCQIVESGNGEGGNSKVCDPPERLSQSRLGWVGRYVGLLCAALLFGWLYLVSPSLLIGEGAMIASFALPLITSPSSYYLEILVLAGLLSATVPSVGGVLLVLSTLVQLVAVAVTPPNKIYLVASVLLVQAIVISLVLVHRARVAKKSDSEEVR